ncbi:MAG: glycoside hydrolase family 3 C-terminal domain-containing protein [Roseburia sp.]|nr:glycoside hydrolase family 3 C-terminal domain-containing protein [Roseburia sp.]
MDYEILDIEKTLAYLTTDEKLRMLSGDGMWHTFGAGELPRVRMSDGPNGLRMTGGAMSSAVPATCYPTPSMLANSWDLALLYSVGSAIGKEATAMGVNLLLAPGLNIKRNPLGGRNFEYYSEDPYLSGELGKAFVSGVQATGVGACVKHFAANNQEDKRMYSDSVVDERALREIYLKPFEIAVEAEPAAVMCAYNKVNGQYCSQNEYLLKTVLRDEWGYKGVTLSDWGAVRDRSVALNAGLDLEMPDSHGLFADDLHADIESGYISEQTVDDSLRRILALTDNVYLEPYGDFDADANDRLSYNAAAASIVLLKNENGFLPLTKALKVAVCGALAEDSPIQGGGSSHVTALKNLSPLDAFAKRSIEVEYYRGYSPNKKENARLIAEALDGAKNCDAVIVYAGAPTPAEGIDRADLELPAEQNELISALTAAGSRVVIVLNSAGPVLMPWINRVRAVVYAGLNGQSGAAAAVDVLYGRINPRGKLAETFPLDAKDLHADFGGYRALYRESIFVGYRFYDKTQRRVLFPFGHGLSFSDIKYDGARIKRVGADYDVEVTLTNASARDAYEIVQIYVSDRTGRIMCPEKQLAGFGKAFVEGKTSSAVTIRLDKRAFRFFDVNSGKFSVADGEYKIIVAASAADIKSEASVHIDGDFFEKADYPAAYDLPEFDISDADFEEVLGYPIPPETPRPQKGEFTLDSCINDIKKTFVGRIAARAALRRAKENGGDGGMQKSALIESALNTPLSAVCSMSDGAMSPNTARGIVDMANGKFFKGLKSILKK